MRAIATKEWLLFGVSKFSTHTPPPKPPEVAIFPSGTGLPSGACAKLRVWVLSYHRNRGPEVARNVLYNKARACAAAPLFFRLGFRNPEFHR